MPGVALHPLPDLARKGDLHAARKNLESIKSHKRCLQHRPTSVNTKTDTDRPKAIDVRPRIHDLRWQASLHSMRASLAARHPQELGTTSKGYTSELVCVEGHTFLLNFSLMDDSKTVILKTYTIESIVRHEKTTAPFVHCPHSAYGKRSPFRTLVHSKRHRGDGARRPADMWSLRRRIIKPSDTATQAATRSAGFRSLTIHRRTTHQGIGLRDTRNDPGKMFFPPQKGATVRR